VRIGLLTQWANRANGGVFEAVVTHAAALAARGIEPCIFTLEHPDDACDAARLDGLRVTRRPVLGPRVIGFGQGMTKALIDADLDVLHQHGIWNHLSADGASWARKTGRPYVISTHGMLNPWIVARGRFRKAVGKAWFERRSWRAASIFHALTETEANEVAQVTGRADIAVIPNGIAIPDAPAKPGDVPTMLCIARIHAVKNLPALLDGWRLARCAERGWRLVIAGWGADADMVQFKAALGENPEAEAISFIGPAFGADKQRLLDSARFVVLPSLSEALPMGILEAWAVGVPTLMSAAIPLPEGFAAGAAIAMGVTSGEIARGLEEATSLPAEAREAMARAGRQLAVERFSADSVAQRWEVLYRSLVRGESAAKTRFGAV
jgi:glycosyltransferase involved in cell wall biosynthesis